MSFVAGGLKVANLIPNILKFWQGSGKIVQTGIKVGAGTGVAGLGIGLGISSITGAITGNGNDKDNGKGSGNGKLGAVVLIVIVGIIAFIILKVLKPSNVLKVKI